MKLNSMLPALALAALVVTSSAQAQKPGKIKIEAETGELVGTLVMKDGAGYSGTGYVGRFEAQNSAVRLHCTAHKGIYEAHIHYRSQSVKGFDLVVNGKKSSAMFAPSGNLFADSNAGKIELKEGANEISIERGWGYYQIDFIELITAGEVKPLLPLTDHLADGKASPKARQLMRTLQKTYGKQTLSGQQNGSDVAYIQTTTGLSPAIISCDLIDYSPSRVEHGTRPGGTTENMIKDYRSGSVISVMWHWNAPKDLIDVKNYKIKDGKTIDASWYRGFYTDSTTFNLAKALSDKNGVDYKLLIRDIDVIALELKKLQAADVPVLWRPLHEAEGGWFWWGAKGADAFKSLWGALYDRLTNHHQLHNLIWVYTSGGKRDWYPGDTMVDVVGADAYPSDVADSLSSLWEDLRGQFDGKKMLTLSEFGGVPDVDRMAKFGVSWAYFASWNGDLGPRKVSKKELIRLYNEKRVVNKK